MARRVVVTRAAGAPALDPLAAPEHGAGASAQSPTLTRFVLPGQVRVVDVDRREIEVCATSEAVDSYGTVFAYEASRDAFERWAGNVREMHERKAVGRRVDVRRDDAGRRIYVRLRISRGAQDTWEKVLDGTLAGASIGASNVEWRTERRRAADGAEREVPVARRYDLVELSLVDLPSNPDTAGVTFVRAGVPDESMLSDLGETEEGDVGGGTETAVGASPGGTDSRGTDPTARTQESGTDAAMPQAERVSAPTGVGLGDGALADEDPAAEVAAAALRRGKEALAAGNVGEGTDAAPTPKQKRLASLGAPGYAQGSAGARPDPSPQSERSNPSHAERADTSPGATYDGDGEAPSGGPRHDGTVLGDDLAHDAGAHAHDTHDHAHTGGYDDAHRHSGPHLHEDGTSHVHEHLHDHGHHDHSGAARAQDRAQAGHAHGHVHTHAHGHYYRVADGSATDARLVTGEGLRTREYVSAAAFRLAGGTEGRGLTAAEYRVAAGVEARLESEAAARAMRAQGAYSRNPLGPADIGTPAEAAGNGSTDDLDPSAGTVSELDRDGMPAECEDESTTGHLDVSAAPEGYEELAGGARSAAPADTRVPEPEVARAIEALRGIFGPELARIGASMAGLEGRVAKIEATPLPGGPVLRAAERTSPLAPTGGNGGNGTPGPGEQYRALEALAGRLHDPQAQIAVATEMIRLQQAAAGLGAEAQRMPRAGQGPWGR